MYAVKHLPKCLCIAVGRSISPTALPDTAYKQLIVRGSIIERLPLLVDILYDDQLSRIANSVQCYKRKQKVVRVSSRSMRGESYCGLRCRLSFFSSVSVILQILH